MGPEYLVNVAFDSLMRNLILGIKSDNHADARGGRCDFLYSDILLPSREAKETAF